MTRITLDIKCGLEVVKYYLQTQMARGAASM